MTDEAQKIAAGPKKHRRSHGMAWTFAALLTFAAIEAFAGRTASVWFATGFVVCALIAFWEAGTAKRDERTILERQSQP